MYNLYNEIKKCIDDNNSEKENCTFYGRDINSISDARFFSLVANQFISDENFVRTLHRATEDAMRNAIYQIYNATPDTARQYILLSSKNAKYYKQSFLDIQKCILDDVQARSHGIQTQNQEGKYDNHIQENQTDIIAALTAAHRLHNSHFRTQLESDHNQTTDDQADDLLYSSMERQNNDNARGLFHNDPMDEHHVIKRGPLNQNTDNTSRDNNCHFENNLYIASLLDLKRYSTDKTAISSTLQTVMLDILNDNLFHDQMHEGRINHYNNTMSEISSCNDTKNLMQRCLLSTNGDYEWCDIKLQPCLDMELEI